MSAARASSRSERSRCARVSRNSCTGAPDGAWGGRTRQKSSAHGDPERLDGAVCVEDGCDRRHDLEWDHDDPVANQGVTSYENMKARCRPDHWAKTERDRLAGKL